MLPDHCKDVSVREVDFDLTAENIFNHARGKKAYTRTEHMILKGSGQVAIIKVVKDRGKELFRPISAIQILSLPEKTVFVKDQDVDVLNRSQMARVAKHYPGMYVVVEGLFNHVSFIKQEEVLELRVFDVVPPYPSKLTVLVDKALSAGLVDLPVLTVEERVDLIDLEKNVQTDAVMFPCRASGLSSRNRIFYLDETPRTEGQITLVGCDLSRRIYQKIYKKRPTASINMCPRDLAPKDEAKRILKCCKIKDGFELDGNNAIVPWGATVQEVATAMNAILKK